MTKSYYSTTCYCAANSAISCKIELQLEETGTDIATNTSSVWVQMNAEYNGSLEFTGSSRNAPGTLYAHVNGTDVMVHSIPLPSGVTSGTLLYAQATTISVPHNADGTKTLSDFYVMMVQGSDEYGGGYVWQNASAGWQSLALTTIPRTSKVSLSASSLTLNGQDAITVYTNRYSTSFSHVAEFSTNFTATNNSGGTYVQSYSYTITIPSSASSGSWTPPTEIYGGMKSISSITMTVNLTTYSGATAIGMSTTSFTLYNAGKDSISLNKSAVRLDGSDGFSISMGKNSTSFTHDVAYIINSSEQSIQSGVGTSLWWSPSTGLYSTIGAAASIAVTIRCYTYSGSALIGYNDVSATISSAGADSVSLDNTNMTMGTAYTVSIAKRVSSFRHTVTWAFGLASGTLGTPKAVDTSVGWTPLKDLSAQIPTVMTGQGTVTCQTYYEDTPIGSTSVAFNLSVPSYNVVLGTPAITETGKDNTGTALTKKGVGATEVVAIMSIKRLVVSATTSYNATIKNISVTFGGSTKTASSGSFDDTFSGMMNGNLTITATDSRGIALASTYSKAYTFQDYFKPSVTSFDGDRDASQMGDTGTLNAAGTFWNKTAGTTANALTGAISISATGATTITPSGGNNWTTAFAVSGVDHQNSYNFKIIVTDSFGFTAEETYTLKASVPVLVKLKHTVRIYRNLVVSNIIKATKGYFTGDLKVGGKIIVGGDEITPLVFANAGSHNGVFRGKDITANVNNGTFFQNIKNGTFKDIYIGDYFTKTVNGTAFVFRVAGLDVYLHRGDTEFTSHHAVIVPDGIFGKFPMNSSNTTAGGYVGSAMYTNVLPTWAGYLATAFGSNLLTNRELLSNSISGDNPSSWAWYDSKINLLTSEEVVGHGGFGMSGHNYGYNIGIAYGQLPLFRLAPEFICNREIWWLRNITTAVYVALVDSSGNLSDSNAPYTWGLRPRFLLG